jgi:hypothetical protein
VTLRLGDGETLRAAAEAGPIRNVYLEMERNTELVVASFGPFEILAQCWQSEMGDMWIGLWALADEEFTASRDGQMAPVRELGRLVRQTGADMDGWSFVRSEDNGSAVSRDGHIVNLGDSPDGYRVEGHDCVISQQITFSGPPDATIEMSHDEPLPVPPPTSEDFDYWKAKRFLRSPAS